MSFSQYLKESFEENFYDAEYVLNYINKLHRLGWEKKKFEDPERVLDAEKYILKQIKIPDTIKVGSFHFPVAKKYSEMDEKVPPIVFDINGFIIDGVHRFHAAKIRGDEFIDAYIPVNNPYLKIE